MAQQRRHWRLWIGESLSGLLQRLVDEVPGDAMFRVGMTNPPYILDQIVTVSKLLKHPRMFEFLHIPVQSGSDAVLDKMNREYTRKDFTTVCNALLENVEEVTIATDIICGFPTETEQHFEETMSLMNEYHFHICNISQFYPRPGTPAAKMKRIDTKIVKNRSRKFSELFNSLDPYKKMIGRTLKVWVGMEHDSTKTMNVGHTKNYTKVLIKPWNYELIGTVVTVKVVKHARFHVECQLIEDCEIKRIAPIPEETLDNVRMGDPTGQKPPDDYTARSALITGTGGKVEHGEHGDVDDETGGREDKECCGGDSCGTEGGCNTTPSETVEENCDLQNYAVKDDEGGDDDEIHSMSSDEKQRQLLLAGSVVLGLGLIGLGIARIMISSRKR
jgi:hypothetical protein